MAKSKKKMKRNTFFSMLITLVSFLYKAALAVISMSHVLMIAALSTFMVFICKAIFVKNVLETRDKKKKAYFGMMLAVLFYSLIFIAFVVLKVNGIDIGKTVDFESWFGILFIALMLILFILSVRGLKGALEKTDLMVIGLKEMTFVSALADLVIIEEFVSLIILRYVTIEASQMKVINGYFSLGVGITMVVVAIIMLIRCIRYNRDNK